MPFYKEIAEYYDYIFPFNGEQIKFVKRSLMEPHYNKKILDIGCGTGDLVLALWKEGFVVTGIDSEQAMIQKAANKTTDNPVVFTQMDMKDMTGRFNPSSFDAVLCFGNTLVHLAGMQEIEKVCKEVRNILKPNGKFLIQILNYDYIVDNKIRSLPLIDNEFITFERTYDYNARKNLIVFKTALTVKETSRKIINKVDLFPMRKDELYLSLRNSNFYNISFYGDFNGSTLEAKSLPLVVEAV